MFAVISIIVSVLVLANCIEYSSYASTTSFLSLAATYYSYSTSIHSSGVSINILKDLIKSDNDAIITEDNHKMSRILNLYRERYSSDKFDEFSEGLRSIGGDVSYKGSFLYKVITPSDVMDLVYDSIRVNRFGDSFVMVTYVDEEVISMTEVWKPGYSYIENSTTNLRCCTALCDCSVLVGGCKIKLKIGQAIDIQPYSKFLICSEESNHDIRMNHIAYKTNNDDSPSSKPNGMV